MQPQLDEDFLSQLLQEFGNDGADAKNTKEFELRRSYSPSLDEMKSDLMLGNGDQIPPLFPTLGPMDLRMSSNEIFNFKASTDKNPTPPKSPEINSLPSTPPLESNEKKSQDSFTFIPPTTLPEIPIVKTVPKKKATTKKVTIKRRTRKTTKTTTVTPRAKSKKRQTTKAPSTRPKKKRRTNLSTFLQPFDGWDSEQLEEYRRTAKFTKAQEKEFRVHLRKIKNRESAISSRQRKKQYKEELEVKKLNLRKENAELEKRMIRLEAMNEVLKSEFVEFQKMIANSTGLSALFANPKALNNRLMFDGKNNAALGPLLQFDSKKKNVLGPLLQFDPKKHTKSEQQGLALLYLLIVLHSYAPHLAAQLTAAVGAGKSSNPVLKTVIDPPVVSTNPIAVK